MPKNPSKRQSPVRQSQPHRKILHVLEVTSAQEIRNFRKRSEDLLQYWHEFYSSLAFQRAKIMEELRDVVRSRTTTNFKFREWVRVVKYRWSLEPLSARGSILGDGGGRFNIGDIDMTRFPTFPAVYLAENEGTACCEVFGVKPKGKSDLDRVDLNLTKQDSYTLVRIEGILETVFDLTQIENLKPYFDKIKNIKFPHHVVKMAENMGLDKPQTVKNVKQLRMTLLDPSWRLYPMQWDIPANPQIFGQIVESAGIQGVIYPSVQGGGKCLAIYPRHFEGSGAYVSLMNAQPEGQNIISRLDTDTWKKLI